MVNTKCKNWRHRRPAFDLLQVQVQVQYTESRQRECLEIHGWTRLSTLLAELYVRRPY